MFRGWGVLLKNNHFFNKAETKLRHCAASDTYGNVIWNQWEAAVTTMHCSPTFKSAAYNQLPHLSPHPQPSSINHYPQSDHRSALHPNSNPHTRATTTNLTPAQRLHETWLEQVSGCCCHCIPELWSLTFEGGSYWPCPTGINRPFPLREHSGLKVKHTLANCHNPDYDGSASLLEINCMFCGLSLNLMERTMINLHTDIVYL